jgi:hypothetical protein
MNDPFSLSLASPGTSTALSPSYSFPFFLFCHSLSPLRVCVQSPHFLPTQQPCLRSSSCSRNVLIRQTQRTTTTVRKEKKRPGNYLQSWSSFLSSSKQPLLLYKRLRYYPCIYIAKPIVVQVLRTHITLNLAPLFFLFCPLINQFIIKNLVRCTVQREKSQR